MSMESKKRYSLSLVYSALLIFSPLAILPTHALAAITDAAQHEKIVTVYLLIDEPYQLQQYVDDLNKIAKPNFNRIIFSFVKPTMIDYQSGSLANTGILGYFNEHDGNGVAAFNSLKAAVNLSKQKNIETFLSVGG